MYWQQLIVNVKFRNVERRTLFWNRDDLVLNCAHFVVSPTLIEPMHGHTYQIKIEVEGTLNESDVLIDFLDLKPIVRKWKEEFDNSLLLPTENPLLDIIEIEGDYLKLYVKNIEKEYIVPKHTVHLLPIRNTTVECLSEFFTKKLQEEISSKYPNVKKVRVMLGEYSKSSASFEC